MEERVITVVNEWFGKNHHMFKLTEYYVIDICCELYHLVDQCVQREKENQQDE